jgi:hypothetical protein
VKQLQPRDIKIAVKNGTAQVLPSPDIDSIPISMFQRVRIRTSVKLFMEFVKGRKVDDIAKERGVTHQRVTQILQLGLRFLIEHRCILIRDSTRNRFSAV